jgi:O-antigen ligase
MIKDNPVLGTGPGTFAIVFTQYQPPGLPMRYFFGHNDYLHFTSELGLPFMGIAVWMIFLFFKTILKKISSQNPLDRGLALGALGGITAILIHSFVDFNLHVPANTILFTTVVALLFTSFLDTKQ